MYGGAFGEFRDLYFDRYFYFDWNLDFNRNFNRDLYLLDLRLRWLASAQQQSQ
jgi:hypothetical protein